MKFKFQRQATKKERKANGRNASEFQRRIEEALKNGREYEAEVIYHRGIRRGYALIYNEI